MSSPRINTVLSYLKYHNSIFESSLTKQGESIQTLLSIAIFKVLTFFSWMAWGLQGQRSQVKSQRPKPLVHLQEYNYNQTFAGISSDTVPQGAWKVWQSEVNLHICGSQVVSSAVKCCWQCTAASPEGTPQLNTAVTPQKHHISDSCDDSAGKYTVPSHSSR